MEFMNLIPEVDLETCEEEVTNMNLALIACTTDDLMAVSALGGYFTVRDEIKAAVLSDLEEMSEAAANTEDMLQDLGECEEVNTEMLEDLEQCQMDLAALGGNSELVPPESPVDNQGADESSKKPGSGKGKHNKWNKKDRKH